MLRSWHLGVAAAIVALSALSASAQQPGQGFGFGGGGGGGGGVIMLLGSEQVQKELELVDDQKAQLTKMQEEMRAQFTAAFAGVQDLSEEERRKRFEEMRAKGEETMKQLRAKVEEILLPQQMDRLRQINLQVQGTRALNEPEVAEALGITEEQKTQLATIRDELRKQAEERRAARQANQGNQGQDNQADRDARRKAAQDRIMAVLTDEQKAKFEELKGEKFELDMSQFQGRGRGQGGGRRRGGNNNPPAAQPNAQ